jgi:hypothetical protein
MFALGIQSSDEAVSSICVLLARSRLDGIVLRIRALVTEGTLLVYNNMNPLEENAFSVGRKPLKQVCMFS